VAPAARGGIISRRVAPQQRLFLDLSGPIEAVYGPMTASNGRSQSSTTIVRESISRNQYIKSGLIVVPP
jgi:hypothetical protein